MAISSVQYQENLCQAIDTIVESRLQGIKYDKTDRCTIIDDSQAEIGKYYVYNGNAKYYAYSENTQYSNGQNVYVLIPQNDYTKDKTILGKVIDENNGAVKVKSPLEDIAIFKTYEFKNNLNNSKESFSILANNPEEGSKVLVLENYKKQDYLGFTKLIVELNINALFAQSFITSGIYGIKISFFKDGSNEIVNYLKFESSEFLNNPYNLKNGISQYKIFDLPFEFLSKLEYLEGGNLEISLFQNNDFYYYNGTNQLLVPYKGDDNEILCNNIVVDNIKIHLGRSIEDFKDKQSIVEMYPINGYMIKENTLKTLNINLGIKWFYKKIPSAGSNDKESYFLLTSAQDIINVFNNDENYLIRKFVFDETVDEKGGGINWEIISNQDLKDFILVYKKTVSQDEQSEVEVILKSFLYDDYGDNQIINQSNIITCVYNKDLETFQYINNSVSQGEYTLQEDTIEANGVSISSGKAYQSNNIYYQTKEISFGDAKMRLCANGDIQIYKDGNWQKISTGPVISAPVRLNEGKIEIQINNNWYQIGNTE